MPAPVGKPKADLASGGDAKGLQRCARHACKGTARIDKGVDRLAPAHVGADEGDRMEEVLKPVFLVAAPN